MVVLPSDHYVDGQKNYLDTLKTAVEVADRRRGIVTIGVEPTRPETGYGYIEMGERINTSMYGYRVARFTEKPNLEVARDFIQKGTYLWNSGMFVFRADVRVTLLGYNSFKVFICISHSSLLNFIIKYNY